jgi:hypothetical protein
MTKARIYQPDKTAMQSGKAGMQHWVLEYAPEKPYFVDNLMGWSGMSDMKQELDLRLTFPNQEEAVEYAKRQRIPYDVILPNKRRQSRKAYADNFKFSKVTG